MNNKATRRLSSGSESSVSRIPVSYTPTLPRKPRATSALSRHHSFHSLRSSNSFRGDDTDSVCSAGSSVCDHNHFAKNGSTFSCRTKKFIVHCSPTQETDEYLTPTQRANATIKKLKSLLNDSQTEVAAKDEEIARLTRELVQLRLGNAEDPPSTGGGDEPDILDSQIRKACPERASPHSLSDSGHFDMSPESPTPKCASSSRNHVSQIQDPSLISNIDILVQKLADANERYYELKPQYEDLQRRYKQLERDKAELEAQFSQSEERHKKTYLEMFTKGRQAVRFEANEKLKTDNAKTTESKIPELIKELEVTKAELESVKDVEFWKKKKLLSGTEAVSIWNLSRKTMYRKLLESKTTKSEQDAEITLKFLKSAFYYFLTDRENMTGHMAAIQSILGFTSEERQAIEEKATFYWK